MSPPLFCSLVALATCCVMRFMTSTDFMICRAPSACSFAAVASCRVMCCMFVMVFRICDAPVLCSCVASETSATSDELFATDSTICRSTALERSTACPTSSCTRSTTVEISRVEFIERSARRLTSSATTAKPLPASPARAASMAAFSARRFVRSAISSMILTILPMSRLLTPMPLITPDSSPLPFSATLAASREASSTVLTLLATERIEAVICSIVELVSSTEPSSAEAFFAICSIDAPIS